MTSIKQAQPVDNSCYSDTMARKLTKKQRKFVKAYIETDMNGTQAALQAYDTTDYKTASVIATENLEKPSIVDAIQAALPDDLLARVHVEGLHATKGVYRQVNEFEYQKIDEEPDYSVRSKYLDMGYKIKDRYAAQKNVNFNVNTDVLADAIKHDLAKFRN